MFISKRNIGLPPDYECDLQGISSADAIESKDADERREHVEDVVQSTDPSVQGLSQRTYAVNA